MTFEDGCVESNSLHTSQKVSPWVTLPGNAPSILCKDTIFSDGDCLKWPDAVAQPQRESQTLAQKFYTQILYGCDESRCTTPTCANCQRWTSRRPFRSFTALSARTLAIYLASEDHAEKRLCPQIRIPTLHTTDDNNLAYQKRSAGEAGSDRRCRDKGIKSSTTASRAPPFYKQCDLQERQKLLSEDHNGAGLEDTKQKDPKSFAQNLFDTNTVKDFYKTRIPVHTPTQAHSRKSKTIPTNPPSTTEDVEKSARSQSYPFEPGSSRTRNTSQLASNLGLNPHASEPRQILSHFSVRNVKALVSCVQKSQRECVKKQSSASQAHQMDPSYASILSFARQSTVYILGSPRALLASFRKDVVNASLSNPTGSIDFGGMVQAFHWLYKIDTRPKIIWSRLLSALKKIRITPAYHLEEERGVTQFTSNQGSFNAHPQPGEKSLEGDDVCVIDEREATHLTMLIFAALVAAVPPCSLEIWHLVWKCHQSGSMVPYTGKDPATIAAVQLVLDAFEDEMAHALLSALCESLAEPTYNSSAGRVLAGQLAVSKPGVAPTDISESVADRLVSNMFQSKLYPSVYYVTDKHTSSVQIRWRHDLRQPDEEDSTHSPRYFGIIAEWLRYLIVKEWDGKVDINCFSAVGGALAILHSFDCRILTPISFQIPVMGACFDFLKSPIEWLERPEVENPAHLLSYPFVFDVKSQITCFRSINYALMFRKHQTTALSSRLLQSMSNPDSMTGRGEVRVQEKLGHLLKSYFVIEVRRENILLDALNQLWRRDEREMIKPLKVRMGMDEGEEGVDHGGVQQEFFRIVIAEIMRPEYGSSTVIALTFFVANLTLLLGMFTIDEQSQMAWFRPCSLEPMYKFELVGLLFSLAIYNGLTLPVNFPFAFYRKLQGYSITTPSQIEDGWPVLAKGLQSLLDWSEGDVADTFARTYEFTAEGPGLNLTVDMQKVGRHTGWVPRSLNPDYCCPYCSPRSAPRTYKPEDSEESSKPPKPPSQSDVQESDQDAPAAEDETLPELQPQPKPSSPTPEAAMVTNANRQEYVSDYIFWLTEKSIAPQFRAFANKFFTCLSTRGPALFNVRDFKRLVEGNQNVTVDALRRVAGYDGGYTPDHPVIQHFWDTVSDFSPDQIRSLLEFVTACDRLPALGARSLKFTVQKNGDGDERLPTSLTCYGKLLLPAYSCKEVLREKLCLAIENSKGFGVP
ncbi:MAG: hypothetical protein Q9219_000929 [cf. Caloplaca sp. 3 TL-2023]